MILFNFCFKTIRYKNILKITKIYQEKQMTKNPLLFKRKLFLYYALLFFLGNCDSVLKNKIAVK